MQESAYRYRGSADLWWFNKANDLRGATAAIWDARERNPDTLREKFGMGEGYSFSVALPPVFAMNAGLSIELLLKAILVADLKGDFEKLPHTHDLHALANKAGVLKLLNENQHSLLQILSEFILWIGKYPVGRTEGKTEASMHVMGKMMRVISPDSKLNIMVSNGNTWPNWDNYNALWKILSDEYWKRHKE